MILNNLCINTTIYDNNQILTFNTENLYDNTKLNYSNNDSEDEDLHPEQSLNPAKSKKNIPIIDMFFNMNNTVMDINKQVNTILKKYESKYNLIMKSNDDFIILNKYVRSNSIEIPKHNLLFTYNYPIYIYSSNDDE